VPTGTADQPRGVEISFDQPQVEMPYEQRQLVDRSLWESFGNRTSAALATLIQDPLISEWWPEVLALSKQTPQLGLAIAKARHRLELNWGNSSFEVPQSEICQTKPFRRFAIHLLTHADRLRDDYNSALAAYRAAHRLRSAAQPLPDLIKEDDWIETPLWIWTPADPMRRPLFARSTTAGIELSDRGTWQGALPTGSKREIELALRQLDDWEQQGIKLRTRALITTLYARLLLADTFIHGIGGAKYDQVTDDLCSRFFGCLPPEFITISGTLRLPIEHTSISPTLPRELRRSLRELRFHPEAQLNSDEFAAAERAEIERWRKQKTDWIHTSKTAENAAVRHAKIAAANQALQAWLLPQQEQIESRLTTAIAQTRKNQLLESREHPFCLFPHDVLRDFLLDFSRSMP